MRLRSKIIRASIPLVVAAGVSSSSAFAAGEWEKVLDEKGVKGYSRTVEGSNILEFRLTLIAPARIELVGEILRDVEGLRRSSSTCLDARILSKKDRNNYIFYLAYSVPWPFDNRDVIVRVTTTYDFKKGRVTSTLRAVREPLVPLRDGFVRIADLTGEFTLEYLSREKTGIVYTQRVDPGGNIPAFLVNATNEHALRSSNADLLEAIKQPKYIEAAARSTDTELVERVSGDHQMMAEIVKNRLGEYVHDVEILSLIGADARIMDSLVKGEGRIGEILLFGWGSQESKRRAAAELLRQLLASHTRDASAIAHIVADRQLIDATLSGHGGAGATIRTAIAAFDKKGQ